MIAHKEDYIDYDRFYTIKEFEQIIANKGVKQCEFNVNSFKDAMKEYNSELSEVVFVKLSYHKTLILKEFVNSMDWEFYKLLKSSNTRVRNIYKTVIENHFEGYIPLYTACALSFDILSNICLNCNLHLPFSLFPYPKSQSTYYYLFRIYHHRTLIISFHTKTPNYPH